MGAFSRAQCVLVVLLLSCLVFPYPAMATEHDALYKDPSQPVEARVADLLKRMSLDDKLGQMTQIEMTVANKTAISKYEIGMAWHDLAMVAMVFGGAC